MEYQWKTTSSVMVMLGRMIPDSQSSLEMMSTWIPQICLHYMWMQFNPSMWASYISPAVYSLLRVGPEDEVKDWQVFDLMILIG